MLRRAAKLQAARLTSQGGLRAERRGPPASKGWAGEEARREGIQRDWEWALVWKPDEQRLFEGR